MSSVRRDGTASISGAGRQAAAPPVIRAQGVKNGSGVLGQVLQIKRP